MDLTPLPVSPTPCALGPWLALPFSPLREQLRRQLHTLRSTFTAEMRVCQRSAATSLETGLSQATALVQKERNLRAEAQREAATARATADAATAQLAQAEAAASEAAARAGTFPDPQAWVDGVVGPRAKKKNPPERANETCDLLRG